MFENAERKYYGGSNPVNTASPGSGILKLSRALVFKAGRYAAVGRAGA
jgi:hypothetical protein